MRMPQRPPSLADLMGRFAAEGSIFKLLNGIRSPTIEGKYLHWDQIRHRTPPAGLNHEEWWYGLKVRRRRGVERFAGFRRGRSSVSLHIRSADVLSS